MRLAKTALGAIVLATVACTDADKKPVDSLNAIDTVKPLELPAEMDSVAIDPTRINLPTKDSSAEQRGVLPPPGGETYRRGSTVSPRDPQRAEDPPPNIIGETRKDGGTMGPSTPPTSGRDSTFGPKLTIDEKGNVVPIKR